MHNINTLYSSKIIILLIYNSFQARMAVEAITTESISDPETYLFVLVSFFRIVIFHFLRMNLTHGPTMFSTGSSVYMTKPIEYLP